MNKRFGLLIPAFLILIFIGFLGGVSAQTTLTASQYTNARTAIVNAADRLVDLQSNDGSWDWDVTNASVATGTTYLNIAGITAEGILNAYQLTGNPNYLTAAEKTGNYLVSKYGSDGSAATIMVPGGKNNINSDNIKFLYDLGNVSGVSSYTNEATILMNKVITKFSTGADLIAAEEVYRGNGNENANGVGNGIVPWDLYNYIKDAQIAGNSPWANDLASVINTNSPLSLTTTSDYTYVLGLVGMTIAGNTNALQTLQNYQSQDGSWSDGDGIVQDSAYATIALNSVKGLNWLVTHQNYSTITGGWFDTMGLPSPNNDEISEVDSEAIQGIYSVISQVNVLTNPSATNTTATVLTTLNLTLNDSNSIRVIIPAGTIINGSASWNGTLSAPQINMSVPTSGPNAPMADYSPEKFSKAFDVGFIGGNLNFNNPVNITILGETGKHVAFSSDGVHFDSLSVCSSSAPTAANLNGGACYYDNGTDIIIWTMHFTKFMTYAPVSPSAGIDVIGGLAVGGGGGGGAYIPPVTVPANNTNTTSVATSTTNNSASGSNPITGAATTNTGAPITGGVIGALTSTWGIVGIVAFVVLILLIIIIQVRKKNKDKNFN